MSGLMDFLHYWEEIFQWIFIAFAMWQPRNKYNLELKIKDKEDKESKKCGDI